MHTNLSLFGDEPSFDVPARPMKAVPSAKSTVDHSRNLLRPMAELTPKERVLVYAQWKHDLARLENDWEDLHVQFLHHQLRQLVIPDISVSAKKQIWAWLNAPLVWSHPASFSAQACLNICDPEIDVEEFRHCLRRFLRRLDAERLAAAA